MRRVAPLILSLSLAAVWPSLAPAAPPAPTPAAAATEAAHQAAMEGYLYFYPLLVMDLTRRQAAHPSQNTPPNAYAFVRGLPQAGAAAPWANPDMLRGTAWLDLSAGPVVLSVPDTGGRLYTLTLVDLWNDAFAVLGKRSTGTAKGNTVLVPPGWSGTLPSGMPRIDAPTTHVLARLLIQADGPAEYPAVHALQDGFVITPLSQWNLPPQAQRVRADGALNMKVSPREQVESLPTDALFAYAAELLRRNPPHAADQPVLARLRGEGLIPGRPFDFDKLDHPAKQGMRRGLRAARERMQAAAGATLREANGWQREAGGVGVYGNAYMRRALAAQAQPGASLPEDLTTLLLAADSRGEAVDGSRRYHLRFASGQLPPAGAFWSLAAYDAQGLLAPNALNRQALGSRDPLRYNEDGSLDLVLGHEAPAPEQQSNWLPLPASGPAQLLLRVYQPGPALLDGLWTPPPLLAETPPEVTAEAAPAPAAPATDPAPETGASAPAASATTATSSAPATPPAKPAVQGKAKPQAQSQPGR